MNVEEKKIANQRKIAEYSNVRLFVLHPVVLYVSFLFFWGLVTYLIHDGEYLRKHATEGFIVGFIVTPILTLQQFYFRSKFRKQFKGLNNDKKETRH
jgi:uncharacterized membrane protein